MQPSGYVLKRPSPGSKGIACLRFDRKGEPYPRETIAALKSDWHFFWFSAWKRELAEIAYNDLIDIFVVWEDLAAEIRASGRTDCVVLRGGSETYQRHDLLFYPIPEKEPDIDILYVARFAKSKRPDIALACVHFLKARMPGCKAVFLESIGSDLEMRKFVREQRKNLRLEENLRIASVGPDLVNDYINRARLSLFTSDMEGLCRSVIQTLLAERWVLCYRHTRALTRLIFDKRYFRFYDHQTEDSIGETAWQFLQEPHRLNWGARDYILKERQFVFHDLAGWQEQILAAAVPLYERDGQHMDRADVVPIDDGTHLSLWREFRLR